MAITIVYLMYVEVLLDVTIEIIMHELLMNYMILFKNISILLYHLHVVSSSCASLCLA